MKVFNIFIIKPLLLSKTFALPANNQKDLPSDDLNLGDSGKTIENVIEIYTSNNEYQQIKEIDGIKIPSTIPTPIINGDSIEIEDIHSRGKTTLHFKRKSIVSFRIPWWS